MSALYVSTVLGFITSQKPHGPSLQKSLVPGPARGLWELEERQAEGLNLKAGPLEVVTTPPLNAS